MTQHFIESQGWEPQFLVFSKEFTVEKQEQEFEHFLSKWEEEFDELKQENWREYWAACGQQIILDQWKWKYNSYLAENITEDSHSEHKPQENKLIDYAREDDTVSGVVNEEDSEANEHGWLELWHQHSEEIYFEQYIFYTSVYYNYYQDVRRSLQAKVAETLEVAALETDTNCADILADDFEQLKLLGLPTSFGGRPQGSKRKRRAKQHTNILDFSLYFSDDEDDTIEDMENSNERLEEEFPCESKATNSCKSDENAALHEVHQHSIQKKKKNKNRKLRNIPGFLLEDKGMLKYWRKRFSLFSRYDHGIRLDRESWFSVTPEKIAAHLAKRLACDILVDGFCGCGGNAIQFAQSCGRVIAIDIDPAKVEMAKHNAKIYGVAHKIDFIVGDFLQFCISGQLRADTVFLSPPWGGPKYKKNEKYDIERLLQPCGATELMEKARKITEDVALFLPRNADLKQLIKLAGVGKRCEVEHNYLDSRLVAITAFYGEDILERKVKEDELPT